MIAVLITDTFIYLIWNAKIATSTTVLCLAGLLNRLLLFVFGANYWLYGMILLYIIYGSILAVVIGRKRFPFESAYSEIDLDDIAHRHQSFDVSRAPEFVYITITVIYVILFVVLFVTEPTGVPLLRYNLDDFTYPYYIMGVFALLLVVTFFALYSTYRLFMRKQKSIQP